MKGKSGFTVITREAAFGAVSLAASGAAVGGAAVGGAAVGVVAAGAAEFDGIAPPL